MGKKLEIRSLLNVKQRDVFLEGSEDFKLLVKNG